jgi:hypothetical protein
MVRQPFEAAGAKNCRLVVPERQPESARFVNALSGKPLEPGSAANIRDLAYRL